MIVQARQARTANRFAPNQTRRSAAQASIFGKYGPSIALWFDAYRLQATSGQTIARFGDSSGKRYLAVQSVVSRQPVCATSLNVKAMLFDGGDVLSTTTAVAMRSTPSADALLVSQYLSVPVISFIASNLPSNVSFPDGAIYYGRINQFNSIGAFSGNLGTSREDFNTTGIPDFFQFYYRFDQTAGLATDKIQGYLEDVEVAPFSATYTANTSTFYDARWDIGSLLTTIGTPANGNIGYLSEIILMNRNLSAAERQELYRTTQELLGLGWS